MKTVSEGNKNETHVGGPCNHAEDRDRDVGRGTGSRVGKGEQIQVHRDSVGDEREATPDKEPSLSDWLDIKVIH